jgi:hypothetical protein
LVALVLLLLWRLPDGPPGMPAIRPALAVSLGWLFLWYYQLPWYDTMAIGLLAVYPASRLDWAVIGQFTIATFANMPGLVFSLRPHWLRYIGVLSAFRLMPLLLLAAVIALVCLALFRRWELTARREPRGPARSALSGAPARGRLVHWDGFTARPGGAWASLARRRIARGGLRCRCGAGALLVAAR